MLDIKYRNHELKKNFAENEDKIKDLNTKCSRYEAKIEKLSEKDKGTI